MLLMKGLRMDLVAAGPDDAPVNRIEIYFGNGNVPIRYFAPTKNAVELGGSKSFAKGAISLQLDTNISIT
ncbi:hypothetical protein AOQ84DRAFT_418558 [Glonium stellatum]|uniref:Uncharacterized protein n=1 Tax=Glonium stellatum TaxID=574774 RepID=A0A8E2ES89_9PEZI|nr:hypothetical protein AOQ84DRAFT_418558 [Glonium stellatum]